VIRVIKFDVIFNLPYFSKGRAIDISCRPFVCPSSVCHGCIVAKRCK